MPRRCHCEAAPADVSWLSLSKAGSRHVGSRKPWEAALNSESPWPSLNIWARCRAGKTVS